MPTLTPDEQIIKRWFDDLGVSGTLMMLATVCLAIAEDLTGHPNDGQLARPWRRRAEVIQDAARRISQRGGAR